MDAFLGEKKEKKGINKVLIVGVLIGVLLFAGVIGVISLIPTEEVDRKDVLEGAFLEGAPEFEKYTKEIIISTNPNRLLQSMTGMGTITMYIGGTIRNKGDKDLSVLEVRVEVIDQEGKVIKKKKYAVIPKAQKILGSGKNVNISVNIAGFSPDDDRANVRWKVTALKFADYEN